MSSQKMANLNAILKWTIEHGHKEDAPANMPSYAAEMSAERREWLKNAIEEMSDYEDVIDIVAKRLQGLEEDGVTPLKMSEQELVAAQERTLEEMLNVIDNIDFAKDFGQIGGADALISLLSSPHAGLRWRSAEVVATVVQNNPACQDMMLERNVLDTLMTMVESDDDLTTRTKAFLGIASQIRGHLPSLEMFLQKGGVDIIMQALEEPENPDESTKLIRKGLFLIPAIVFMRPTFAQVGRSSDLLNQCLTYCTWGIPTTSPDTDTTAERKEGDAINAEEDKGGPIRESALKAVLSLLKETNGDGSNGNGNGLKKDAKKILVKRSLALAQIKGKESTYYEDEVRLLMEIIKIK